MTRYAIKPLDLQSHHPPSLIPRIPSILNVVSPIGMGKNTLLTRLITEDVFFKGKMNNWSIRYASANGHSHFQPHILLG